MHQDPQLEQYRSLVDILEAELRSLNGLLDRVEVSAAP
jgi:hypothetical protein